ncbi:Terpene cyclase [Mycena sanguinolenta]|uniref:Terpene synthase n=1 Tax=Mycena sanguinolenta TaxID=230812 RepID=A0A8H6YAH8_9AGAR|nr:Terpene cyclase [Mycena sanguinolenta]
MRLDLGSHDYVQTLKGQKLRFPNFDGLVKDYPRGISPHYEVLKEMTNAELELLVGPGPRYDALVACDCALNSATWFPNATFDALRLNAWFVAFLYVWDDEFDSPHFSDLGQDPDASEKLRLDTIEHIKKYLGDKRPQTGIKAEDVHMIIASFNPVGEAAGFRMNRGQRKVFMDECIRYVLASGDEQRSELSGRAPTIEQYMHIRMGTSAVSAIVALIEYMTGIDLGDELRADDDITLVREATNCVINIMNDVFSLRRELIFPFYNNAVAVLYHENQDLQKAVDETYKIVADAVANLEAAHTRLLKKYPGRREDLEVFVTGAKGMCTGNIEWSKRIRRYHLGVPRFDGTTEITL